MAQAQPLTMRAIGIGDPHGSPWPILVSTLFTVMPSGIITNEQWLLPAWSRCCRLRAAGVPVHLLVQTVIGESQAGIC